ncbi:hypothetical protein DAPPUDRAFT_257148 [Daphnia pulex]|uniref:Retrotransposon gag domain-containing protein n=1 Tax=Daphnia pulex TaxID=6669 RepID=E9HCY3_DAPPU|nr:hypothetical protein DAPPUDRAFT_257148 [Daphnia pulex]|eukprot:EFX70434.1 hypothetical protein DAPPUDRAFT_257148 [Daphnia pulex]
MTFNITHYVVLPRFCICNSRLVVTGCLSYRDGQEHLLQACSKSATAVRVAAEIYALLARTSNRKPNSVSIRSCCAKPSALQEGCRVPVFTGDGTDDVEEWLWKVGLIFERFFDEQEELLETIHYRLAGKAAQFFRVEGENVEDFEGCKEMFLQRFQGENEGVLESKFQQCQQAPGELVVDYAQILKVFAMRLYGDYMQVKPVQMTVLRQF